MNGEGRVQQGTSERTWLETLVISFIKGQGMQRMGHFMRRNRVETTRAFMVTVLEGKTPRGRPRKRTSKLRECSENGYDGGTW